MRQVAQNYRTGELAVLDVPAPACRPGGVLVRSLYSLISTGTEVMKVSEARMSLLAKARARPDQVRKVLDSVSQNGPVGTYKKVMNRLDAYTPLGYSVCGVVVAVGGGAEELHVGQVVAAAGNEFALHAEVNWVPVNLCVPVPDPVAPEHAAFATVGAIALQGVRRAEPQLGDSACVVGLGLVGQLVVRLLVAAGVRVVGIDTVAERCRLAEKAGAVRCAAPSPDGEAEIARALEQLTGGLGADHVLLAAGGSTNGPVELAARLARDRARVVDIGKCRLDLPWNAYYSKELDVRFSRSYGPGRYDDRYELDGVDYPAGYVRWTERRNLACFVDLLAQGVVDVGPLVSGIFDVGEADAVYARLSRGQLPGVGFLFSYPTGDPGAAGHTTPAAPLAAEAAVPVPRREVRGRRSGALRVGFVGAGAYASTMLLPHLARDERVELAHVATTTSLSAATAQRRFGFRTASTDASAVLDDDSLDAVFVVTRHSSHADLVCRALERGHAVFVEKPLALDEQQLRRVEVTIASSGNDRLMVGFNRRFAPLLTAMRADFGAGRGPVVARYLVNAGRLDSTSWYRDADKEGSRFLGEGGHFLDTLAWWTQAVPVRVDAVGATAGDDVLATVWFSDGSLGHVAYLCGGNPRAGKEVLDVLGGGASARLDDFTRATTMSRSGRRRTRRGRVPDKGQRGALRAFLDAVRTGAPLPVAPEVLLATTRATIAVERSRAACGPVTL
jgi:predicted dehydrogenase/threonine dehydrogenase-like Zn-dependent dehydrogenase